MTSQGLTRNLPHKRNLTQIFAQQSGGERRQTSRKRLAAMPEPMAPATMPMTRIISIRLAWKSPSTTIAAKPLSGGKSSTPAVQRLLISHSAGVGEQRRR